MSVVGRTVSVVTKARWFKVRLGQIGYILSPGPLVSLGDFSPLIHDGVWAYSVNHSKPTMKQKNPFAQYVQFCGYALAKIKLAKDIVV
jgi:hypothetical protein